MRDHIRAGRAGALMAAAVLATACSTQSRLPAGSARGTVPASVADDAPAPGSTASRWETQAAWAIDERRSAWAVDAERRACVASSELHTNGSTGLAGRSGSALLVSGSAGPEPGDVPVRDRLEQMGFVVTVKDDDLVSASDADGMHVVLISESVSSEAIGSEFTSSTVPVMVWERGLFDDLKMSDESNWHTDPQDTIVVSDPSLTCGVSGEVTVVTSDEHPMNRARPPASATVVAVRTDGSDDSVWFGFRTGDVLTDGSTAPAARMALWFTYDTPRHTNELGWELFARAVEFAVDATQTTGPKDDGELETADAAADDTSPPSSSVVRSGPPVPATSEPSGTAPTDTTASSSTAPPTTAPAGTRPATTAPNPTAPPPTTPPPTTAPAVTDPPTTTPPVTTTPTATTAPPTTAPPVTTTPTATTAPATTTTTTTASPDEPTESGGGKPPWASGPKRPPDEDSDDEDSDDDDADDDDADDDDADDDDADDDDADDG